MPAEASGIGSTPSGQTDPPGGGKGKLLSYVQFLKEASF